MRLSSAQHPREQKHSIQDDRIAQAKTSKHGSPHNVGVRVRVRILVGFSVAYLPTITLRVVAYLPPGY